MREWRMFPNVFDSAGCGFSMYLARRRASPLLDALGNFRSAGNEPALASAQPHCGPGLNVLDGLIQEARSASRPRRFASQLSMRLADVFFSRQRSCVRRLGLQCLSEHRIFVGREAYSRGNIVHLPLQLVSRDLTPLEALFEGGGTGFQVFERLMRWIRLTDARRESFN